MQIYIHPIRLIIALMNKNPVTSYERQNPYKIVERVSPKLAFKPSSNARRIQTEAYDPMDEEDVGTTDKFQFSLANYKSYLSSNSTKKTTFPSYLDYKKISYPHTLSTNTDVGSPLNRNTAVKVPKDAGETYKLSTVSKVLTGKNEDYRKHARVKTQACDENINEKISQLYAKLNSVTKEKPPLGPESNYRIEGTVGKGTFGVVYKATNITTCETVAIKKVLQDKRYKNRELQIMKMLHHPNLLEIKDHYYTKQGAEQYLNVVMDFYEENLNNFNRNYLRKGEQIPPLLVKIYAFQMFKSINYLAALSIAHRDIKPHNILIDPNSHKVVICDFGSAKQLVPNETNLAYICSRCYRAPELIFGATDYTPQIDVWSIGCVVVEMVNGEPPFMGDSQLDQLIEIIKVLGTPSKAIVLQMNKNYDMRQYKYPLVNSKQWRKILRPKTDPLLVDLITKVMQYSPMRRLTAFEAMCHPYFDDLRNKERFQEIVAMTGCTDLLKFSNEQAATNKDFIEKLVPFWYK